MNQQRIQLNAVKEVKRSQLEYEFAGSLCKSQCGVRRRTKHAKCIFARIESTETLTEFRVPRRSLSFQGFFTWPNEFRRVLLLFSL